MSRFFAAESIPVNATPVPFTRAVVDRTALGGARADHAVVQVKGKDIYFNFQDPDVPLTAANSFQAPAGSLFEVFGYDNIIQFKAITQDGTADAIYVEYES